VNHPLEPYILIASSDNEYAMTLTHFLQSQQCQVERCHDPKGVFREVGKRDYQVLVLDLGIADEGTANLVSFVTRQSPDTQTVLLFDINHFEKALDGIRHGAYFYLPKSSPPSDMAWVIEKALMDLDMKSTLKEHEKRMFEELMGSSPAMLRVSELITKVAPTDSTVLLLGESGTGKEVMANAIHQISPRRGQPFIAINCAALPEQILESELFGHVKGAFTGAEADKIGLFEAADGGTLFLDEVGDMPLVAQAKLLRVLQSGEIRRVGESTTQHVNVRVLAATNKDLVNDVSENNFREDLYFRLNVFQIKIPPLRERRDALPHLVKEFVKRFNARYEKRIVGLEENALNFLAHYEYPGNIRELESIIAHAVIMADGDTITANDLPDQLRFGKGARLELPHHEASATGTLQDMEKDHIERALKQFNGNQTEVAKSLGISRSTLWRKMKEYGLSKDDD
jgi:two-component system, NtrC family, response regulator AtoC